MDERRDGTRRHASCARSTAGSRSASTGRRSRGCAATRRTRRRRATRARRVCASTTTRTVRTGSPRRCAAAPTARSRRSTGTPRSPRSRQRFQDVIAEHGGDKILFYGGGGQGNHLGGGYGGATRSALGIRYTSNALAQEKTGEFWVDGQLFGRSRCHTDRRLRARRGRRVLGQEPVAVARLPAGPPDPQGDRQRPDPHADRRRPAPHRVGRPRRHPPAPAAGRRRPPAGGDAGDPRRGRPARRRAGWPSTPTGSTSCVAHLRTIDIAAVVRQGRRRRGATCADAARAIGNGDRRRVDLRGPRHPDGAALDAQQLPREAGRAAHRQLRRAGWR